jgi:site-specific DNA-methyltransferase (adenine-specific)
MRQIEAGSVDLVFADPPFNIGYEYDAYDDKQDHESYLDWSRRWIEAVHRILKPDGTFWLAIGDEYAAQLKLISENVLPGFSIGPAGFHCRSWVIWYYTFGMHCTHKFTRSHTHLFHFVKNPKKFTFNADDIRVPSARQLVYNDSRANPDGRMPDDTWIIPPSTVVSRASLHAHNDFTLRPQDIPESFRADGDTWYFSRVAGTFRERRGWHGCQMPERLLGRIIRASSNEKELVLDPFSGSGTTLAVAKKLGRRFVGFDMSEQYVASAKARLKSVRAGDKLDGTENPLLSAPPTGNSRSPSNGRRSRPPQTTLIGE